MSPIHGSDDGIPHPFTGCASRITVRTMFRFQAALSVFSASAAPARPQYLGEVEGSSLRQRVRLGSAVGQHLRRRSPTLGISFAMPRSYRGAPAPSIVAMVSGRNSMGTLRFTGRVAERLCL